MNDTDGLLAEAQVEGDDNQQQVEETTISHQLPDNEPSLDSVTVAKEDEEIELARPDWYPEKFWNDDDGPDLENLVKSYNELQKSFLRENIKPLRIMIRAFLSRPGLVTMTLFIMFIETGQKKMASAKRHLSNWLEHSLKWLKAKVSKLRSHIKKNMKSLARMLMSRLSR